MTRPNRLFTTWPDTFWVILMVIGGWLATTAPVGPLLMALGLFMAVFCAQCLSRRQSEWEGYRRGFRAGWTRARSGSARGCSGRPTTTMPLVIAAACGFGAAASVREQDAGVAGIWRYNEEMSTPLPQAAADGQGRAPREGAPRGGSRGGMRGGGMPPDMPGLGRGPSPEDMQTAGGREPIDGAARLARHPRRVRTGDAVHLHALVLDGGFAPEGGRPRFYPLPALTTADVADVLRRSCPARRRGWRVDVYCRRVSRPQAPPAPISALHVSRGAMESASSGRLMRMSV